MTRKFKPWNKTWLVYFVLSIWAMWNDAIFFLNKKHLWYLEQTSKNTTFWIFEFDDKQYYSNSCESWIPDTLDTNCIMPKENMFMDLKKMKIFVRKVHKRCKNTYSWFGKFAWNEYLNGEVRLRISLMKFNGTCDLCNEQYRRTIRILIELCWKAVPSRKILSPTLRMPSTIQKQQIAILYNWFSVILGNSAAELFF